MRRRNRSARRRPGSWPPGNTHYSDSRGDEELRIRIAQKLQEENHAPYQPDQILVTPGAKMAVYLTVRALLNAGDEAIWLTPGWVSYPSIVEISGGVPVAVHLNYEEDYRITREAAGGGSFGPDEAADPELSQQSHRTHSAGGGYPGSQRVSAGTSGCVCIIG